jgi:hypothetical protein
MGGSEPARTSPERRAYDAIVGGNRHCGTCGLGRTVQQPAIRPSGAAELIRPHSCSRWEAYSLGILPRPQWIDLRHDGAHRTPDRAFCPGISEAHTGHAVSFLLQGSSAISRTISGETSTAAECMACMAILLCVLRYAASSEHSASRPATRRPSWSRLCYGSRFSKVSCLDDARPPQAPSALVDPCLSVAAIDEACSFRPHVYWHNPFILTRPLMGLLK